MVRNTRNQGLRIPEAGDDPDTAAQAIEEFLEAVDRMVALRGHETSRPDAGDEGRLFLDTSTTPPTLAYDRGDSWRSVAGDYDIPPNLARTDRDQTFSGNVTFENAVDADITGNAAFADEAEHAHEADEATDFAGDASVDNFVRADREETIEESWTYESRQTYEQGANVTGGTVDLPVYDGSDPSTADRDGPAMWARLDHQPQN